MFFKTNLFQLQHCCAADRSMVAVSSEWEKKCLLHASEAAIFDDFDFLAKNCLLVPVIVLLDIYL